MAGPVIALGVYELLAAGAAATGVGAYAVTKRREIADSVSDGVGVAQSAFRETTLQAIPYIVSTITMTGTRLWRPQPLPKLADDLGPIKTLPLPPFADVHAWDSIGVPILVGAAATARPGVRETPTGRTLTDLGQVESLPPQEPPSLPDPLKPLKEGLAKVGNAITQHPLFKIYQWTTLIYGWAAILWPSEEKGPLLYDHVWKRFIGESAKARAVLGLMDVVAAESSGGMLALAMAKKLGPRLPEQIAKIIKDHTPTFAQVNLAALLGAPTFYQTQMVANHTKADEVDVVRARRNAGFLGFTSTLFFPLKDAIIGIFGGVKFAKWWGEWGTAPRPEQVFSRKGVNWLHAQIWRGSERVFGKTVTSVLQPDYLPSAATFGAYTVFITAFRNAVQWATSSVPGLENSDVHESLVVTNARHVLSVPTLDLRFTLGASSSNLPAQLVNQVAFMVYNGVTNEYSSAFDGKDVAVNEAKRAILHAPDDQALLKVVRGKPLTDRNFFGFKSTDLAEKTWAHVAEQFAKDVYPPKKNTPDLRFTEAAANALLRVYDRLSTSTDTDDCQSRLAAWTLLAQVAYSLPGGISGRDRQWRMALQAKLGTRKPQLRVSVAGPQDLEKVYDHINGHAPEYCLPLSLPQ